MKQVAASDAKNRFGRLIDAAQTGPVQVTRKGRAVGVLMSVDQYERLRGAAWDRLASTLDAVSAKASRAGLTDEDFDTLLADES